MKRAPAAVTVALLVGLLAAPIAADAQPAGKVARIGALRSGSPSVQRDRDRSGFWQALREMGWIEGRNLVVEPRYAEGKPERFPELAAELVRLGVDLIVSDQEAALLAAKRTTTTVPIVMVGAADPVGLGLVQSLARPGGNVTGTTWEVSFEQVGKQIELLKSIVPTASRWAALRNPGADRVGYHKVLEDTARTLTLEVRRFDARGPTDLDRAFAAIVAWRADILTVGPGFTEYRRQVIDLAARHRLPALYTHRPWVEGGGLMSYALNLADLQRTSAVYVDKILRGARPAELPVQQPAKFDLVLNLRTAKALDLTIPPSVLIQAEALIE